MLTLLKYQPLISRAVFVLGCICALSVLFYSIFLLEAVAHAASQTAAQHRISEINAKLGDLESQYLTRSQTLTLARAQELGYVVPTAVTAVYANAAAPLSFRGQ